MIEYNIEKGRRKIKILIISTIILIILSLFFHENIYQFYKENLFSLKDHKIFPIIFIVSYIIVSFFPFPFTPYSFIAGFIFPLFQAFIYTLIASTIFAIVMFYISRYLGKDYVHYWLKKDNKLEKLDKYLKKNGFFTIFLLRLFFIIPTEVVSIFAGLSNIKTKDFIIATVLGNMFVLFFSISLIRGKMVHNDLLVIISIIALIICIIIPLTIIPNLKDYLKIKRLSKRN